MFGKTVLDLDGELFADALAEVMVGVGRQLRRPDPRRRAEGSREALRTSSPATACTSRRIRDQLLGAIGEVFRSWNTRAPAVPPPERIPNDLGTAVNVQAMVFGNPASTPAPGVAFTATRPPVRLACTATTWIGAGRGRGLRHPTTRWRCRTSPNQARPVRRTHGDHDDAGEPLPRPVRHRVHDRARQTVDAADPCQQAHRRPRSASRCSWWTRA